MRDLFPATPVPGVARIGVVVPYDMALDHELWRWAPADVSLLFTRTPYVDATVTPSMARTVGEPALVASGVQQLMVAGPCAYVYACTAGSFINGLAGEQALTAAMTLAGGAPAITTSGALLLALTALGVTRIATATPYDADVSLGLTSFLAEGGVEVVATADLGLRHSIWTVDPEGTRELVRRADRPDAEAVVISCTNLPTYDLIADLEAELGKPVISANQATMWATLRLLDRACRGTARLLAPAS